MLDVFIASRLSKMGKPFAFVRFAKSVNTDTLLSNLGTIRIDKLKLITNLARFQRGDKGF